MKSVYSAVRTGALNLSSLRFICKGLISVYNWYCVFIWWNKLSTLFKESCFYTRPARQIMASRTSPDRVWGPPISLILAPKWSISGVKPPISHMLSWHFHTFNVLGGGGGGRQCGKTRSSSQLGVNSGDRWSMRRMRSINRSFLACSMESRRHSAETLRNLWNTLSLKLPRRIFHL